MAAKTERPVHCALSGQCTVHCALCRSFNRPRNQQHLPTLKTLRFPKCHLGSLDLVTYSSPMFKTKQSATITSVSFLLISFGTSAALAAPPMAQPQLPDGSVARVCLKPEDMKKSIPFQQAVNPSNCDIKVLKQTDLRVEWQMTCSGEMSSGTGWAEYQKNAFTGETVASANARGMPPVKMVSKFNGKRLGPCQGRSSN
jgi:hypothetical protein